MEIPKEFLSKEFLSQFKTGDEVDTFLNELHTKLYEQMLEAEMDNHLGYEKHSKDGSNTGNSRNGSYPKTIRTQHGKAVLQVPRDREGDFEPIAVPKHQSRGSSIDRLVISLYVKGMSVSDIESEMHEIYGVNLSTSAISIITNKVNQAAIEWQNRPLDTKNKLSFPTDDALKKSVYLSISEIEKKWTIPIHNWGIIFNQFSAIFENRIQV